MEQALLTIHRILDQGLNTNSYKFALCRALVALVGSGQGPLLTLEELAEQFVSLYWPLEILFHLRQGIDPRKDPVVMRRIRELADKKGLHSRVTWDDFQDDHPAIARDLVGKVSQQAFSDVLPRFHTVHKQSVRIPLYRVAPGKGIEITEEGFSCFKSIGIAVDSLAIGAWVRFTETYSSAPRLYEKLAGAPPKRTNVTKWAAVLREIQGEKCFYCDTGLIDGGHVDHFLPWSFLLEDKTWNLVLACEACNETKSDRLASERFLEAILARNDQVTPKDGAFAKDFSEWATRSLGDHIRALHRNAQADEFPEWSRNT